MLGLGAAVIAVIAASYLCFGFLFTVTLFIILSVVYALVFHWSWCVIAFKTIPRDLHALICYIKILLLTRRYTKKNWTMPDIFHYTVEKHPDKPCFFYQDEVWTFKEVEDYSLRVTSVLRALEIRKGQVVGMLVSNCPQFPALWLGNARLGAITPLINTNQRGSALLHSITIASCDVLIFSEEFEPAIKAIQSELSPRLKLYKFSHRQLNSKIVTKQDESPFTDFTSLLEYTPPGPWQLADAEGFSGKLLYIYTSGTTGLPKAAVISNARVTFMTAGVHVWRMNKRDVIYCPLPLYHTAGGVISVGQALLFGCSVIIKSKFSASQFFPDCIKYKATVAHYIGEMCRYILATPPSASDTKHQVRLIFGNGLRPQVMYI
ncbi:long-chain fatty acid transport protein 4-like [Hyposmocoma kahamanoa]|uniref:long-chain fatty acid transport protein 4-like n=1 Tax=Hyposmocoma kahamanoa TaxID=1477025 RepID=UPI000E6D6AAB|nr:long-chain fatty acid transport protein 4-like [Hyposmocoma kahamanoa]